MATYYVRTDGSNANAGTGSSAGQAWQTIGKIFASGSVVTGGDIVYIAPGTYTETISVLATSPTSEVQIVGNPTASLFSGITAGPVKLSAYNAAGTTVVYNNTYLITATSKNYYSFSNLVFEGAHTSTVSAISFFTSRYIKFTRCVFRTENNVLLNSGSQVRLTATASTPIDATFDQCYFGSSGGYAFYISGTSQPTDTTIVKNCYFDGLVHAALLDQLTATFINCTFVTCTTGIGQASGSANAFLTIKNCLFKRCTTAISGTSSVSGVQTYNRFVGCSNTVNNIPSSVTSTVDGVFGVDTFESLLFGLNNLQPGTSYLNSPNTSFGNATGAPATDLYGVTWTGATPDAGAATYRNISSVSTYLPTERNASTITIAPGSTSQSIELYLGATGLTASTAGLSARYNRTRTASVDIPLVARTIAQAWTSGGFAEVDSTNMPGVYRIDLPDAALAAGADDVTIVVRGASGTNGAVMTVKLSSGGLTSAQTAAAVWDAATASYTNNGSFGLNVLRADQQNKAGNVTLHSSGNVNRVDADVHAIANDADAATELKGALLHNGTDYISADLLTPVSAATSVHIGPYQLLADGLGADQPLDVNVGTATSIDVQVTDANGTGIDITGATVSAKVYNSGGTLVATYAGTATYADNGRLTFGLTTTVTATSGTYTVTVTRTTGATDTQIFGPLRLYVRPV
jgi:hypothetical protein